MGKNKKGISELMTGMREIKGKMNRINVKVDTNDADYSITETIINENEELIQVECAVLLATLYKGMGRLDDYFDGEENATLIRISESEEEQQMYESLVGDLLREYVDFTEGHTLEKVELFYDNKRYEVVSAKDEVIKRIMERWVKEFV